ncbi:MAG: hypothetical protein ACE5JE_09760 [Thermoplasmata archaeon]
MKKTTLTLKFRGLDAEILDRMVASGLFNNKSEAVRASLVRYALELGFLRREDLWTRIGGRPREVSDEQLARDLEGLEDEA